MSRMLKNYKETQDIVKKFSGNPHMLSYAILQFIEREKFRVMNQYRKERGEPLLTEAPLLPGNQKFEWIIPVPASWVSMTGLPDNVFTPKEVDSRRIR